MDVTLKHTITNGCLIGSLTGVLSNFVIKLQDIQAILVSSDGFPKPSNKLSIILSNTKVDLYPLTKEQSDELYSDLIRTVFPKHE